MTNSPKSPKSQPDNPIAWLFWAIVLCWPFFLSRGYWLPVEAAWVLFMIVIYGIFSKSR
jgi:hypothetical protein